MDKRHLIATVALNTGLDEETVCKVFDEIEEIVLDQLKNGKEIHWGSFIRMWTTFKRPALPTGAVCHKDTDTIKLRYRMPNCAFASKIIRPMKEEVFNIADKSLHSESSSRKNKGPSG